MKATVGDRLIVERTSGDQIRRKGVVVAVEHTDGSPPYLVRWLDTERESLVFPGPDARIVTDAR
ncbi:hypothetical protein Nocox_13175 [Nonomuraea coxensis DSM 45129]|uniref:DUF1918 domain-containing protein n=1 Tax=Nonomuraea coxensis DSM 45129 TaxID=1122611 RepID=A0ABX8TXT5_9ACTN|nr:DUF1918 domain-containing protein [Nonomuraea coxensis]QYC40252.1 hypothetical protein Nocox_13175 [Nonomuraea coxensis DSM 45129]